MLPWSCSLGTGGTSLGTGLDLGLLVGSASYEGPPFPRASLVVSGAITAYLRTVVRQERREEEGEFRDPGRWNNRNEDEACGFSRAHWGNASHPHMPRAAPSFP